MLSSKEVIINVVTYQGTVAKQDTKHGIWDVIIAIRSYGPVKVANIIINAGNCCLYIICNTLHLFCKQRSEKCVNQRALQSIVSLDMFLTVLIHFLMWIH